MSDLPAPNAEDEPICSRQGCHEPASSGLLWNNPKIHTPERRKVWLACDDHLEYLNEYLSVRGFLKQVVPASELGHTDVG